MFFTNDDRDCLRGIFLQQAPADCFGTIEGLTRPTPGSPMAVALITNSDG
jgi:hypothetical protein